VSQKGTTSEQNLNDDFAARGIKFTARVLDGEDELYPAYDEGECDAVTSDSFSLAAKRQQLKNPADHIILGDRISREPLGPVIARDDNQWLDVISWTVFATIYAEELRVDQRNVDRLRASTPIRALNGCWGWKETLARDWGYRTILPTRSSSRLATMAIFTTATWDRTLLSISTADRTRSGISALAACYLPRRFADTNWQGAAYCAFALSALWRLNVSAPPSQG
jgi:hypothetical protein